MSDDDKIYSKGRNFLETISLAKPLKPWLSNFKGRSWTKYVPNTISITRLPAALFVVLAYSFGIYTQYTLWTWVSLGVSLPTMLSDVWDGFLAKLWRVESELGMLIDPIVDKVLVCVATPGLTYLTFKQYYVPVFSYINLIMAIMLIILELVLADLNKKNLDQNRGTARMSGASKEGKKKYTAECVLFFIMAIFNMPTYNKYFSSIFVNIVFFVGILISLYFAYKSRKGYKERLKPTQD